MYQSRSLAMSFFFSFEEEVRRTSAGGAKRPIKTAPPKEEDPSPNRNNSPMMSFLQKCFSYRLTAVSKRFVVQTTRPTRQGEKCLTTTSTSNSRDDLLSTKTDNAPKRSRRRFRRMDDVLSYRDFMHRQSVISLYRQFLQAVRSLPDRTELQAQIKKEFSSMKHEKDAWNRKRALQEGQRRLKDLQVTLSTSVTFGRSKSSSEKQETTDDKAEEPKVGMGWPWERS